MNTLQQFFSDFDIWQILPAFVFLIAIIGKYTIKWFATKWEKRDKAVSILGYVATASLVATAACGIVYLFA